MNFKNNNGRRNGSSKWGKGNSKNSNFKREGGTQRRRDNDFNEQYSEKDLVDGKGIVKWFNAEKGFGFVEIEDVKGDVFVHISVLQKANLSDLDEGQELSVKMIKTDKNYKIVEIIN